MSLILTDTPPQDFSEPTKTPCLRPNTTVCQQIQTRAMYLVSNRQALGFSKELWSEPQ